MTWPAVLGVDGCRGGVLELDLDVPDVRLHRETAGCGDRGQTDVADLGPDEGEDGVADLLEQPPQVWSQLVPVPSHAPVGQVGLA